MKLGLATRQAISGVPKGRAHMLAQWVSLGPVKYSPTTYRESPARTLAYIESGLDAAGYRRLVAGDYDEPLRRLRAQLPPDAIIRWDQEMTGRPTHWRTWGAMDPGLWVAGCQRVASILGPLHWAPGTGPRHWDLWPRYWPGDEHVGFAGFTSYDTKGERIPAPRLWRRGIGQTRELTAKPILVSETATRRTGKRGGVKWLRSWEDVQGVWGACYFDVNYRAITGRPSDPDWTMTPAMRREWAGMVS